MQRDADLLLFLAWKDKNKDVLLTGKLFEYLSSLPLILSCGGLFHGEADSLIEEAEAGFVALEDSQKISEILLSLTAKSLPRNRQKRESILKRYERSHLANKLLELVTESA